MHSKTLLVIRILFLLSLVDIARAGMPAPLPTNWTADNRPDWIGDYESGSAQAVAPRVQAISFFLAVFLLSGWMVRGLWNFARRDFPLLPVLSYGRSLGLVGLWGLAFVIVLTMISGARELMTPGAWRKQGWTYRLAGDSAPDATIARSARQRHLEQLRTALWQYAATHSGQLPTPDDDSIDPQLWQIPGWGHTKYLTVPHRRAESVGRLFVFEPELDGEERLVLLTNGMVGNMSSATIKRSLSEARSESSADFTAPKSDEGQIHPAGETP